MEGKSKFCSCRLIAHETGRVRWCIGQEKEWSTKLKRLIFVPVILLSLVIFTLLLTRFVITSANNTELTNKNISFSKNNNSENDKLDNGLNEDLIQPSSTNTVGNLNGKGKRIEQLSTIVNEVHKGFKNKPFIEQNLFNYIDSDSAAHKDYPTYFENDPSLFQMKMKKTKRSIRELLSTVKVNETSLKFIRSLKLKNITEYNIIPVNGSNYSTQFLGKPLKLVSTAKDQYFKTTDVESPNPSTIPSVSNSEEVRPFFWHNQKNHNEIRKLQSKIMQKYMNPTVDPCTNFYEFSCGNWKNYYTIPPDRATYDTFEMVRENLDHALKDLLIDNATATVADVNFEKNIQDSYLETIFENDTSDATVKAKKLYKSCMQEDTIEQRGDSPLRKIIEELRGWPIIAPSWNASNFDVVWLLGQLRLLNNDVLIAQWVGPDMKNSNEYIIHLDQTSLGLPAREYYLEKSNLKYVRAYKTFILNIVTLLGANFDEAQKDVDDIIHFEKQLAEIMASIEERRNLSEIYLRTDIAMLSHYFPQFNWNQYFEVVLGQEVGVNSAVACYCAKYLHKLIYLLSTTRPRVIQNYLIWRFVRHRTNNLDRRFMEAKQKFYFILFGREKQPPRWQFCVSQVNSNMGMALGSLFVEKYFNKHSRTDTIEMTERLEEAFRDTLLVNTWLDSHTKEYARMKINQMDLKIGYPDFILNKSELSERYFDVTIHPEYFFENILNILKHLTRVEQSRVGSIVNRTIWSTPPALVNAYYSRNKNQIMFPAGMLQPPFYHRHFPKALNFGGIGVVIGHEITHGFDDKGRLFDHHGNLHLWWKESSIEKFYEKSQCMIDQYSQYVLPEIKMALDGYLTQGENIADNGGLKQSFRAYETWLDNNSEADETLPDLNFTGRQLFFLNFAQVWCGQQRVEAAKSRIKTSVHAPGIFRVIGVLSNSEEFARVFKCPKNSPMNPEFKCTIW